MPLRSSLLLQPSLLILLLTPLPGIAQTQPMLVGDFLPELRQEGAEQIVATAPEGIIFSSDSPSIRQLWFSDGTPEGTRFWAEACTGACVEQPDSRSILTVRFDGRTTFWAADDGIHGSELWTSDGTSEGTRMVADICPGRCSSVSRFSTFELIDGRLYFSATTADSGLEPWVSDGSPAGTYPLGELRPGSGSSSPHGFIAFDNGVVFRILNSENHQEWWWTDGTPENTHLFNTICEDTDCAFSVDSAVLGDSMYALVENTDASQGIYRLKSGETPQELFRCVGCFDFFDAEFLNGHERLLIRGRINTYAVDETGVAELPLLPGVRGATGVYVIDDSTELVVVEEATFSHSLYRLDDQAWIGPLTIFPGRPEVQAFADHLRIVIYDYEISSLAIWRSDGTEPGTVRVESLGSELSVFGLFGSAVVGDQMLFKPRGSDEQLWTTDGSAGGAVPLFGQTDRPQSSNPGRAVSLGSIATYGVYSELEFELGRIVTTDGTAEGTETLIPEVTLLSAEQVSTPSGPRIFLSARDDSAWVLPWLTDGTEQGTVQLGFEDSGPAFAREPIDLGGSLLFFADRSRGQQLWRSNGTAAGTEMVIDLNPNWYNGITERFDVYPREHQKLAFQGTETLVFVARTDDTGSEVWQSDGTAAGTRLAADLWAGPQGSEPEHLTVVDDRLFFVANDGTAPALWTWQPGGSPIPLTALDEVLAARAVEGRLFWAEQRESTVALRVSDGTPEGTVDIAEQNGAVGSEFVVAEDRVFFALADDRGAELWVSHITDGTRRIVDLWPGSMGSYPHNLTVVDDSLYFSANDGKSGQELWRLSLATLTVSQVADVTPGTAESAPREIVRVDDHLLFSADTPETGRELWSISATTPACVPTEFTQCLRNGRFSVSVRWKVPSTGDEGLARVLPGTDDSAFFWFFSDANLELIVKVLDGTVFNDHHWLFYGSLSDVEYWIEATDHELGTTRIFHNPPLELGGDADPEAFPESPGPSAPLASGDVPLADAPAASKQLSCVTTDSQLCLLDRFLVSVDWQTGDGSGSGTAIPFTEETGLFWFFNDQNIELAVKVLDGRDINDRFWVFFGALSDVAYDVHVTDTLTQATRTYRNQAGNICGQSDTQAFPG